MASPALPYATYRLRSIPSHFDKKAFEDIVPLVAEVEAIVQSSLSPDCYSTSTLDQVGTITFSIIPRYIAQLDLKENESRKIPALNRSLDECTVTLRGAKTEVSIDSHFYGFTPLNKSSNGEASSVNVIAVTGLGGKAFMSWQHQSGAMWLRDYLPRDVPDVQVFTYGYPSKLVGSGSHARLQDYVAAFLLELKHLCSRPVIAKHPLILLGHSYGGLIIKQAIIEAKANTESYGRILNSVYSVFFFGVPHRGLNTAAIEQMTSEEPTKELISDLKEGSTLLRTLNERFPEAAKAIKFVTCSELVETPTTQQRAGKWERTGRLEMMVSESSASFFSVNEERITINANHSMIAKLSDEPGSAYHAIQDIVSKHVKAAPAVIEHRHLKIECAAALAEVYPLAQFVCSVVCVMKGQDVKARRIRESFESEVTFLKAFSGFLVDEDLGKILESTELSTNYPRRIATILNRLRSLFSSYGKLAAKFHKPSQQLIKAATGLDSEVSRGKVETSFAAEASGEDLLQAMNTNEHLFVEDTLADILEQCKRSTAGLREAMTFVMLCTLRFDNHQELEAFRAKREIHGTDLTQVVKRQHLTLSRPAQQLPPLSGRLEKTGLQCSSNDVQFVQYLGDEESERTDVIIEYRRYEADPPFSGSKCDEQPSVNAQRNYLAALRSKMRELATLLHDSSFEDNSLSATTKSRSQAIYTFQCLGFLEDSERYQMAYIFRIPKGISLQSISGLQSLSAYIDSFKQPQKMSPLEQRFSLAQRFCQTVLNLHACGWVHKSIRSRNVILVPTNVGIDKSPHDRDHPPFLPYLKGFEFSRPEQGRSSGRANFDPKTNLYRHPDRQDVPTKLFRKEHDIYAVGVVLLEIGLWRTVTDIFESRIVKARQGEAFIEPVMIKNRLLGLAQKVLPMEMGTKYAEAVRKCLSGELEVLEDDKQQTSLGLAFRDQVLDLIESGSEL